MVKNILLSSSFIFTLSLNRSKHFPQLKTEKPSYTIKYVGELNGQLGIGSKKVFDEKYNKDYNHIIFRDHQFSHNSKQLMLPTTTSSFTKRIFSGIRGKTNKASRNVKNSKDRDILTFKTNIKLTSSFSFKKPVEVKLKFILVH
jgi:hypothetical protein